MDLMHGQSLVGPCNVRSGRPAALAGAGVVVVAAGVSQQPGETRLGRHYEVDPQSVHAYVLGEHGDTEFVPWSIASIGGTAADEIIARKGWTNWAIGSVIRELVAAILRDERTIAPVSVPLAGEYGMAGPW